MLPLQEDVQGGPISKILNRSPHIVLYHLKEYKKRKFLVQTGS